MLVIPNSLLIIKILILCILLIISNGEAMQQNLVTNKRSGSKNRYRNRKEVIKAYNEAVATDDGRCSKVGRDILREGGNAVDAAVAAAFCLGVVSPASSGIGGGAFMVVRLANGTTRAISMRETAPLKASTDMYGGNATLKASGALSIAVPGQVLGLYKAWKMYGKLPWRNLVRPSELFARGGYRISPYLHLQMVATKDFVMQDEGLRQMFTSNGELLQVGEIVHNEKLGWALRAISLHGPKAFYNGPIGKALVEDITKVGGIVTLDDLKSYEIRVKDPIVTKLKSLGLEIITMPPPSSGGPSFNLVLNILSEYGFPKGISGSLGVHRLIEALKHTFAVRMNLGDPDFVNVTQVVSDMLSPQFAAELKSKINDSRTYDPPYYGSKWNVTEDHGTTHLSIVDKERNAVSMTCTINTYFGSKILSPKTGIVLNNQMDDFSMPLQNSTSPPSPANFIMPRKRPLSSMTPSIILKDGELKGVIGASGGALIIAATAQVFLNHFAKEMDPFSSILAPRVYHVLYPNKVKYENWTTVSGDHIEVPEKIRKDLEKKGHLLEGVTIASAMSQFIVQNNKVHNNKHHSELVAVSDPRKGGFPAGD